MTVAMLPGGELPSLAGRDLDSRDFAFVRSVAHGTPAAAVLGDEDALGHGLLGYWKASLRFDATLGAWAPYAALRVRGEIIQGVRTMDPLSRGHRDKIAAGELPRVIAPLPLHLPLTGATSISRGEQASSTLHLEDTIPEGRGDEDHELRWTVDAAYEQVHRVHPVAAAVLRMTYQHDLHDADIASLVGVGASRVSQIRTLGRELLRELLPRELLEAA